MNEKIIGNKIRQLRRDEGMTLEQLALALSMKKNMLSNYELGKSSISADLLIKIADYFNVSLDEFTKRSSENLREDASDSMKQINVYSKLYSDDLSCPENSDNILYTISLPKILFEHREYFGMKITNESLNLKSICRGDIVIAKKQSVARVGDLIIYSYKNSAAQYGTYSISDNNIFVSPYSSDPAFMPSVFNIQDEDFKIIGKITLLLGSVKSQIN